MKSLHFTLKELVYSEILEHSKILQEVWKFALESGSFSIKFARKVMLMLEKRKYWKSRSNGQFISFSFVIVKQPLMHVLETATF